MNWQWRDGPTPATRRPLTADPTTDGYDVMRMAAHEGRALIVVRTWFVERADRTSWSVMLQDYCMALASWDHNGFEFIDSPEEIRIGYASPSAAEEAAVRLAADWRTQPVTWDGRNPATMG